MSQTTVTVVIAVVTFIVSVSTSIAVAGMKWQKLQDKVESIEGDVKEIKGMFTMRLRE